MNDEFISNEILEVVFNYFQYINSNIFCNKIKYKYIVNILLIIINILLIIINILLVIINIFL